MRIFVFILLLIYPLASSQAADCCPTDPKNQASQNASAWAGDLTAIDPGVWNEATAKHLTERAGFGASPSEIKELSNLRPEEAINKLMAPVDLPPFEHSGIHDPGLEPFPPSRPATTNMAKKNGEALGVKAKPSGNRRLQPVVNKFFYWLRASRLETDRLAYWWADRMLTSPAQLREKMALFWHGHFAVNENKVRDYRKHLQLLEVIHRHGLGSFRELLIEVAKSPAMLSFLDAGVNVKGSPNENFAREIMELFTMGPGLYTEEDIREAARCFTGWNYNNLDFVINSAEHDTGSKTFLGKTGKFNGTEIIDIILEQPATAEFLTNKIYRYFVHENPSPEVITQLAGIFRNNNYDIEVLVKAIFLSRDFYSTASVGNHIKSPVELVVSTYRKLELNRVPGIPDLNGATTGLGQHLFNPPTVAGWAQGKAWITPGLLIARTNFAYDLLNPDIKHIAYDRYSPRKNIRDVSIRLEAGANITEATSGASEKADEVSMANRMADMDQDFNTRYGVYRGWQMAIERVKPIPRHTAGLNLVALVRASEAETLEEVVDHFAQRLLAVPLSEEQRSALVKRLKQTTGTDDLSDTWTYLEDPLRDLVFAMMSLPEYQLG
jgi:uncharacterized protein (DUF1800 family)